MPSPKYPNVHVRLVGEDGNIFAIMGRITMAMRKSGIPDVERNQFMTEVTTAKSYGDALQVCMKWVDCE